MSIIAKAHAFCDLDSAAVPDQATAVRIAELAAPVHVRVLAETVVETEKILEMIVSALSSPISPQHPWVQDARPAIALGLAKELLAKLRA